MESPIVLRRVVHGNVCTPSPLVHAIYSLHMCASAAVRAKKKEKVLARSFSFGIVTLDSDDALASYHDMFCVSSGVVFLHLDMLPFLCRAPESGGGLSRTPLPRVRRNRRAASRTSISGFCPISNKTRSVRCPPSSLEDEQTCQRLFA